MDIRDQAKRDWKLVTRCRICNSSLLKPYLNLGDSPLPNKLLNFQEDKSQLYPLSVLYCENCSLSQLSIIVDPEVMYKDYPYHSSVSQTFKDHCRNMAIDLKNYFPKVKPHVLDIASNDGCLLKEFREEGYYVAGVEPCKKLADKSREDGIETVNEFFSERTLPLIDLSPGYEVITATNVFAHIDDIHSFLKNCHKLLKREGILVIEVPYAAELIFKNQFDTIYHEHLSYFLLKSLLRLFESCDFKIWKVEEHEIHGGSLRIYASRNSFQATEWYDAKSGKNIIYPEYINCFYREEKSVRDMEEFESVNGLYYFKTYKEYANKVSDIKDHIISLLEDLKRRGKRVVGYGASAKGAMFLNCCNIGTDYIEYIVDDTKEKQGKFIPGVNIPIVSRDYFEVCRPDYILILSWNFSEELKNKTKYLGTRYITAIPRVELS